MRRAFMVSFGAALLGTSVVIAAADLFLWDWARAAHGQSDIVARGPFLLGAYLPLFLLVGAAVAALLSAMLARRVGRKLLPTVGLATLGVLAGFALAYVEPTGLLFRVRSTVLGQSSLAPALLLDVAVAVIGVVVLVKGSLRPSAAT